METVNLFLLIKKKNTTSYVLAGVALTKLSSIAKKRHLIVHVNLLILKPAESFGQENEDE